MKPAPFDYCRASSPAQAVELLARHRGEARLIAGGQSLAPMLNLRMARPEALIDINGLAELAGIAEAPGGLHIGALARHADVAASALVARHAPLLTEALGHVAHPAIRHRGSFGGSLCHADPAAELPACVVALGAELHVLGPEGTRSLPADAFFHGPFQTALAEDEMLLGATLPHPPAGTVMAMDEIARRPGDYAIAGACATARPEGGRLAALRLVFFGISGQPELASRTAAALDGVDAAQAEASLPALLAAELDPDDDPQACAAMRLHYAAVLARRLIRRLLDPAVTATEMQA